MSIYWSMMGVTALLGIISYYFPKRDNKLTGGNQQTTRFLFAFLIFGYIILMAGARSSIGDTPAYIETYNDLSSDLSASGQYFDMDLKGWGFWFLSAVFKSLLAPVTTDYTWWLLTIAVICGLCVMRTLYKHSVDFPLTAFLFLGTATYQWMFNGIRQFLVASILFAFADWIFKGKILRYIVLILVLSTLHNSALVMIPICIIARFRPPWNKKILFFIAVILGCVLFADNVTDFFAEAAGYGTQLTEGQGSSLLRVVISAVPCVIAFWKRGRIRELDSPVADVCINMSVVTTCFYLLASFTSGTYIGRIPIYFSLYNLLLLPWLIHNVFNRKERALVYTLCVICYLYYFYTTMYPYYSSVLLGIRA